MKLVLTQLKILLSRLKQQKCKTPLETEYWCDAVNSVKDLIRKYELLITMKETRDAKDGLDRETETDCKEAG